MTPLRRIAQASAAFLGSNVARAALGFGLSLAVGRGLGADRFGQWVLCTAWASLLTVAADLGFGVLLTRDGARANAPAASLVRGALTARLAVVVPLGALLYASAGWIATDPETIVGLRVAAPLGIVSAAYGCFSAILISQPQWLPIVVGLETVWLAAQLAASWWIVAGTERCLSDPAGDGVQMAQIATASFSGARCSAIARRRDVARTVEIADPARAAACGRRHRRQSDPRAAPLLLRSRPLRLLACSRPLRSSGVCRLAPQAVFRRRCRCCRAS